MALHLLMTSFPITTPTKLPSIIWPCSVGCLSRYILSLPFKDRFIVASKGTDQRSMARRSGTYRKHNWECDFVESLTSKYVREPYIGRADKLKAEVRMMLEKALELSDQLELIDALQRLGLAYHFEDEIKNILEGLFHANNSIEDGKKEDDLYSTALEFILLRQHGLVVPQDVFNHFKDEDGNFRACLCDDLRGMLYLYEASHLLAEGESILEDARLFTTKNLEKFVKPCNSSDYLSMLVSHALEAPLAWRVPRLETRWFIDVYETKDDMEPILLELAKLDFNMVQATHQEELKHFLRSWKQIGLAEKLDFARFWLVECFFWAVGCVPQPSYGHVRRVIANVLQLSNVMDDIYDVYGTLDELELLTDAIVRWDISAMDQLPDYMKLYFMALYNSINEMAYHILKDQGFYIIPYLKKAWADLCKSFLVEAKWCYAGYTPTLQEYLDNGCISISMPNILMHVYFLLTNPETWEASQFLEEYSDVIRWSSIISRLLDDLGTSLDEQNRGDAPTSIQCYMQETSASEKEARDHIRFLVMGTWKKINRDRFANPLYSQTFIESALNMSRMANWMFQDEDGYEIILLKIKKYVQAVLIQPI